MNLLHAHKNFLRSETGASLVVIAFTLGLLMIVFAVVLDTGRMYAVQAKIQNSADAALLGAVATRDTTTDIQGEVTQLFNANYPTNYMGSTVANITVTPPTNSPNVEYYDADITVTLPGMFSSIINDGPTDFHIHSQVRVGFQCPPGEVCQALEMALVLDNTGSMGNAIDGSGTTKIDALKTASTDLVNILFGNNDTLQNLHISVVPYDIVVQIGTGHDNWMQTAGPWYSSWVIQGGASYQPIYPFLYGWGIDLSGSHNTESLLKYQDLENGYTLSGAKKGFAGNRQTDVDCGPYWYYNFWTCPAPPGNQVCNTCAGGDGSQVCTTDPNCPASGQECNTSCDPETGHCSQNCWGCQPQSCTICHESCYAWCTPGPHFDMGWDGTCYDNGLNDIDDTPPTAAPQYRFRLPFEAHVDPWIENPGQGWGGTNAHQWTQKLAPMIFASNVKADLLNDISTMQPSGDTRINVGLMWGWFTLSPKWQGLWDGSKPDLPAPFNPQRLTKALVLMTDGKNDQLASDDTKTKALCDSIKASGITIYSIGLGAPGDLNESLLQYCASQPTYYFNAPTTNQLKNIFHQIADIISSNLTEHLTQ